jgi:hypothetical protein
MPREFANVNEEMTYIMRRLQEIFVAEAKITVFVRVPSVEKGDILLTDEPDPRDMVAAVERLLNDATKVEVNTKSEILIPDRKLVS